MKAGHDQLRTSRLGRVVATLKWAWLIKPRRRTIKRIQKQKSQRASGQAYVEQPSVSVIVQSFNQVKNIATLESRLRRAEPGELIVCEDGSTDGSLEVWAQRLTRPNDFLLRSNDLHEIRTYGRAISFARGEIVCLMQDDDRPPADGSWLAGALGLFTAYPKLAVLGGWCGFNDYFDTAFNAPWLPAGKGSIPFVDPTTRLPLVFVENVNIGPYFLRKTVFEHLGGFDMQFSAPGEPGITFESEFCYRVWKKGYQVALTDIPVKIETGTQGYIRPGGTSLWGLESRQRNERVNKSMIRKLYDEDLPGIKLRVRDANGALDPAPRERG